jgi:O6-methylguanine-DNA--protein-cysteine methyltransferase
MKRLENDFEKAEAQFAKADKKAATKLKETRDKLETAQNALKKEFTLSLKKMSDEWQAELKKQKKTIKKVVAAKTEKEVTQKRSTTSARKVAIGKKD